MSINLNQIISIEDANEVKLYPKRGIALKKGRGAYVFDTSGKKYLDFMTNIGVNILGYSNSSITKAIVAQLELIPSTHQTFYSEARAELIQELKTILPPSLNQVIFTNSGTEAVEAALKLAMAATKRSKFMATFNSYHGRTLGSLSVTGQRKYREPFLNFFGKVTHIPFNDIEALKKNLSEDYAALILEPIQGEAGIVLPDPDYLKEVKKLCKSKGVLLILDEIQSAIRVGSWFAFESYGVIPDILCLSKSFSYGIPFGVVITSSEVGSLMPKGGHGSTFAGNPLSCVAACTVIKQIKKKKLLMNARIMGDYFMEGLKKLNHPAILNIRGRGLWIGIELKENTTPYLKKMQDNGLIASSSSSSTIRFLPPINVGKKETDQALVIIKKVFSNV